MSVEIAVTEDLATCQALRRTVFIEEQNVPEADEVDGRDAGAVHLLARVEGRAVGTARLLVSGDSGKIGRVCVLAEMRGKGIGARLIEAAVREFAANPAIGKVKLSAQINALSFYERLGFTAEGDEYLDAGIVHRDMFRTL
ncbi:MAG: GNAT family N-acetyltransferase [Defluviimonas denitrificans]|jgi:ElaA protein